MINKIQNMITLEGEKGVGIHEEHLGVSKALTIFWYKLGGGFMCVCCIIILHNEERWYTFKCIKYYIIKTFKGEKTKIHDNVPNKTCDNDCEWKHLWLFSVWLVVYCLIISIHSAPCLCPPSCSSRVSAVRLQASCLSLSHLHLRLLIAIKTTLVAGSRVALQCFSLAALVTVGSYFCLLFLHIHM